ncbi:MAG: STAS domain-containing protein [Phaeodactylibacter sp.]|nr:STAS domain-containing protein [Phaeodactylibacter sp.]MCB9264379.1 STAS domain-containing protein [Lewinellaceae bacterium]MCB9286032.1 STAS domain-containing protein [Lewinellaceae bacterium]
MNPNYNITKQDSIQVLEVKNLLNEMANKEILQAVQSKIDEGFSNFVVDLGQIPYMNSVGLNFLIMLKARSNDKGGNVAMANVSTKVLELLEMTKLRPIFQVNNSVEEAVAALLSHN